MLNPTYEDHGQHIEVGPIMRWHACEREHEHVSARVHGRKHSC